MFSVDHDYDVWYRTVTMVLLNVAEHSFANKRNRSNVR